MTDETMGCNLKIQAQSKAADEDEQLVAAAKDDPEAFGELYDKYYLPIFRYIYHRTLNVSLTEELTSNTFFAALRHIGRFKWRRIPFGAWLYRIATNEVNMHYRNRRPPPISLDAPDEKGRQIVSSFEVADSDVEENLVRLEEYATLHKAILTLKPKYQTVITLRFFEDKSINHISAITGAKEGTVKSQLHRAIKQLREVLTQRNIKEG